MTLFDEQGYQATTVPQIVERAGLTTRTFFRHFADKRDVLFLREREFPQVIGGSLAAAPPETPPLDLVRLGLRNAALELEPLRRPIERRRRIIRQEAQLRERELLQYDRLSDAVRTTLLERGTRPREALLLGRLAALAFELGLDAWLDGPSRTLAETIETTCSEILPVPGARGRPGAPRPLI